MKNPDDLEQRLQRAPLLKVPGEWRAEILERANAAGLSGSSRREEAPTASPQRLGNGGYLSFVNSAAMRMGRELFWPHPRAWAGLAAVWIFIFGLQLSTGHDARGAGKKPSVSAESIAELKQQKQLFVELVGGNAAPDAKPSKSSLPRPRSERRIELRAA